MCFAYWMIYMQFYWCVWFNCHRHHDHTLKQMFCSLFATACLNMTMVPGIPLPGNPLPHGHMAPGSHVPLPPPMAPVATAFGVPPPMAAMPPPHFPPPMPAPMHVTWTIPWFNGRNRNKQMERVGNFDGWSWWMVKVWRSEVSSWHCVSLSVRLHLCHPSPGQLEVNEPPHHLYRVN